jgi:uncharacterized repeat protein (TIGR03803 family)
MTLTTLVTFNGANGSKPDSGLIADANGDLFGTTSMGGANGQGTVFEIVKTAAGYASTVFEIAKTAAGYASTPTTLFAFDGPHGAIRAPARPRSGRWTGMRRPAAGR